MNDNAIANVARDFSIHHFYHRYFNQHFMLKTSTVKKKISCIPKKIQDDLFDSLILLADIIDPPNEGRVTFSDGKSTSLCELFTSKVLNRGRDNISRESLSHYNSNLNANMRQSPMERRTVWDGLTGLDRLPSPEDWQILLNSCGMFMYWGCGRMLSHLPATFLTVLDLTGEKKCLISTI
jgi:hypothetical protein